MYNIHDLFIVFKEEPSGQIPAIGTGRIEPKPDCR